jgi:hypothetical protein
MRRLEAVAHRFVEEVPRKLEPATLYISLEYGTVVHLCCCGCGEEVVTPLSPVDWKLIYDGETVSLDPSIGSWSLPCRSHYWITRGCVRWSYNVSEAEIAEARDEDRRRRRKFFSRRQAARRGSVGLGTTPSEDE